MNKHDCLDNSSKNVNGRLGATQLADIVQEVCSNEISIRVTDVYRASSNRCAVSQPRLKINRLANIGPVLAICFCATALLDKEHDVLGAIGTGPQPRVRVVTIFSRFTLDPLQITPELLQSILGLYDVPAEFLSVLSSFGHAPHSSEASNSQLAVNRVSDTDNRRGKSC